MQITAIQLAVGTPLPRHTHTHTHKIMLSSNTQRDIGKRVEKVLDIARSARALTP